MSGAGRSAGASVPCARSEPRPARLQLAPQVDHVFEQDARLHDGVVVVVGEEVLDAVVPDKAARLVERYRERAVPGADLQRVVAAPRSVRDELDERPAEAPALVRGVDGEPWLAVPATAGKVNAEAEEGVEGSMLEFYRDLVRLRRDLPVLAEGRVRFLDAGAGAPKVIAFERTLGDVRLVSVCSFDARACTVAGGDLALGDGYRRLAGNYDDEPLRADDGLLALRPQEAVVYLQ